MHKLELRVKYQKDTHLALFIISLKIVWTSIILPHAHPQVVYCNCVKFHQYLFVLFLIHMVNGRIDECTG